MTDYLTTEDALLIAGEMGLVVCDPGLLAAAVARPGASVFGADTYPSLAEKVAALIDGVNRNHPLLDGNKRLSWVCAVVFARLNGVDLAPASATFSGPSRRRHRALSAYRNSPPGSRSTATRSESPAMCGLSERHQCTARSPRASAATTSAGTVKLRP